MNRRFEGMVPETARPISAERRECRCYPPDLSEGRVLAAVCWLRSAASGSPFLRRWNRSRVSMSSSLTSKSARVVALANWPATNATTSLRARALSIACPRAMTQIVGVCRSNANTARMHRVRKYVQPAPPTITPAVSSWSMTRPVWAASIAPWPVHTRLVSMKRSQVW